MPLRFRLLLEGIRLSPHDELRVVQSRRGVLPDAHDRVVSTDRSPRWRKPCHVVSKSVSLALCSVKKCLIDTI